MKFIRYTIFDFILPAGILFLFQFIGNQLNKLVIFLPGPIIGMLLLLLALTLKIVPFSLMERFSGFLVQHMSFFLIPTSVSLIVIIPSINNYILRVFILLVGSLVIVLLATGSFASWYKDKSVKGDTDE